MAALAESREADRIRAARLEALDRALDEGDVDETVRLLGEFRPKELDLLVPYAERKLAGDEGGAARLRQQLEDCLALERGDLAEIRELERRNDRQIIGKVTLDRRPERCAPRPRERRERRGQPRARMRSSSRGGDSGDGDAEPAGRGAPVGDTSRDLTRAPAGVAGPDFSVTAADPCAGPAAWCCFQRPRPLGGPEKGERL
jgi:hypothetical protein